MPNTFTQIYVQIVFAVQGRQNLIHEKIREKLEKYMCGIVSNKKSKPIAIYCNPDHTHILIGLHPSISISDMARDIKANSSKWINDNRMIRGRFSWQEGFGAFTYSKSHIDNVAKYILNQPVHHKKTTFKEEYINFLEKFEIEYDEKYVF
ncbi:MAG: IS200/IS605 family transposase [Candidatus Marinimicrobia bacterium]|nr:IS200/IS605 family transposase [Candidatus Neomarinimicrobiota bacterium]